MLGPNRPGACTTIVHGSRHSLSHNIAPTRARMVWAPRRQRIKLQTSTVLAPKSNTAATRQCMDRFPAHPISEYRSSVLDSVAVAIFPTCTTLFVDIQSYDCPWTRS